MKNMRDSLDGGWIYCFSAHFSSLLLFKFILDFSFLGALGYGCMDLRVGMYVCI
jgi:hypothetical protein